VLQQVSINTMASKNITEILISFLKESKDKLDNFNTLVQEHESYVEELYFEVLGKIKNPDDGGSMLPKTPAPKGRGRGRKKQSLNDQLQVTDEQSENRGNEAGDITSVPTRFGRAASRAANAKIKVSQRQLNDLSSKLRRPVTSATDVTSSTRHSNNSDSGMYDRLSSWSTASSSGKTSSSSKSVLFVPVQMNQQSPVPEDRELTSVDEKQDVTEEISHPEAVEADIAKRDSSASDCKRRGSSVPQTGLSKFRKTGDSPRSAVGESPAPVEGNQPPAAVTPEPKVDTRNRLSRSLSSSKKSVRNSRSLQPVDNDSILKMVVDSSMPLSSNNINSNNNNNDHKECFVNDIEAAVCNENEDYCDDTNLALSTNHKMLPDKCTSDDNVEMINTDTGLRASQDSGVSSPSSKSEVPREIIPEFEAPLADAPSSPPKRTTRTKTRQLNNTNLQQSTQDPQEHYTCGSAPKLQEPDPSNARSTRTKKRIAESIDQANESDDSIRSISINNNKKRKIRESVSNEKIDDQPVCFAVSDSEDEVDVGRKKSRTFEASIASQSSASSKRKNSLTRKQSRSSASISASEESPSKNKPISSHCSPKKQKHLQRTVVTVSSLSQSVLAAAEPQYKSGMGTCQKSSNDVAESDDSIVACPDVQHVSVHDTSDESVHLEEKSDTDTDEGNKDQEEEAEEVVQFPRRVTRSKVRQQQQQKLEEAEQLQQQLARAAAARQRLMSSKQPVLAVKKDTVGVPSNGKFSPRPFSNRIGVKQLAAAYSEHVAAASPLPKHISRGSPASGSRTPLPLERKRLLGRSSSTSRVPNTSSRMTPLTINRMRTNLAFSSDSHNHRAKLGTPSHGSRPRNLVCGVKSFLGASVQAARPTKEQVEEQKQLELMKKREKEQETLRKKEEQLRNKRNEAKRRNEERMRKVQEARQAAERRAVEVKETAEKEKKLKEQRLKEEALKKKQLMIKKAEEEKRKRDEEQLRKEEEAKKRKEEAEEKKRALLEQQEEEKRRLEEARIQEEERRAEERRLIIKREEERVAREKEELRLLKEREAARAAANASKPPILKPVQTQKTLNQTYDANSTYILPGNSTFTVPVSSNTPKTPKTPNMPGNKASTSSQQSYDLTPAVRNEHDYGIADLRSDESSDDDCNPKKKIPKWATRLTNKEITLLIEYEQNSYNDGEDDDYISSEDDGEADELLSNHKYRQSFEDENIERTQETPVMDDSNISSFKSKSNVETWTEVPQRSSLGRPCDHNIVRERSGPTNYAKRNVGEMLRIAMLRQEFNPPNVDLIFPLQQLMRMPDLEKIFPLKKCPFRVRSSSAHWTTPPHKIFSNVN
ncbi:hypothetical protein FHG87_013805, partial [Trinorchestia longiramus]